MYRALLLTTIALLVTGPALADSVCSTAPATQFKPKTMLEEKLKAEGLNVRQVKIENGCYEVYAIDKSGKKVNVAYNAETLKKVDNPEAGEN